MLYPVEDFFRNSERSSYQISPDGLHLSFMAPYAERMNIFVQRIGSNEAVRITSETHRSIAGYMWTTNSRILFMKDNAGDENYQLWGVNIDGEDMVAYTDFPGVRTTIIDDLEDIEDEIIIGMNKRSAEVFDPYRLNLKTKQLTLLAENPGNWQGYITDHAGRLRATTAIIDGVYTQILYRDNEDEDFRPIITTDFKESVDFMEFTPDNLHVYAATNLGRDKTVLVRMDPATCEELELLYENERYDISSISYSRKRKKLLAVYCQGHRNPIRHYFDEEEAQFRELLRGFFEGKRFGIIDTDKDEQKYLIYVGGDRTRGCYYYYEKGTPEPILLAEVAPWLKEEHLVEMHDVSYTTRDGLEIEAYLSLPQPYDLATAKQLPIIVNPHGGPWARDTWGYSSEVQFFCNRGYAVFQMNFRGSTGYGRKFLEASYKQWGQAMQDDITDGVEWLISQGIADPKRIAIYGGSYGGYATLAGLCFTPHLYACGIDYVGVSNLLTFMNTIPPYWRPLQQMMYEQIGHPEHDYDMLCKYSPALHSEQIKAPLFIAQGANDPRVNKAESDQMVQALTDRGVEVEYMVKYNEGHGFSNQENRFDFYRKVEKFLAKHIG